MSLSGMILPEFDLEMAGTRKVLGRVPGDRLGWQPHPRSHTIGWNANHLAEIPSWATMTLRVSSLDLAPPGGEPHRSPSLEDPSEILDLFDRNVAEARSALAGAGDEEFAEPWSLLQGGRVLFTLPRGTMIRSYVLNHIIHHRAVLCVYLRLNDVPVPGMYGPSGDD